VVITVRLNAASKTRSVVGFGCSETTARMQTVNVKKIITRAEFAKTGLIRTVSINSHCSRVSFLRLYHASNKDFLIFDQLHRVSSACHVITCPLNISGAGRKKCPASQQRKMQQCQTWSRRTEHRLRALTSHALDQVPISPPGRSITQEI
jgi:hypothetical protein